MTHSTFDIAPDGPETLTCLATLAAFAVMTERLTADPTATDLYDARYDDPALPAPWYLP